MSSYDHGKPLHRCVALSGVASSATVGYAILNGRSTAPSCRGHSHATGSAARRAEKVRASHAGLPLKVQKLEVPNLLPGCVLEFRPRRGAGTACGQPGKSLGPAAGMRTLLHGDTLVADVLLPSASVMPQVAAQHRPHPPAKTASHVSATVLPVVKRQ